jgi:subtilisin family serine protease
MLAVAVLVLSLQAVWGLAPLYTQRETVDRVVGDVQLRSYFVIFNEKAPLFGQDRAKLAAWIDGEFPAVDSHQINHLYQIGDATGFRGFSIWAEQVAIESFRAHEWVSYVEEDMIVRLPDSENPYLFNLSVEAGVETGAPFTTRPDWGQVRGAQKGSRNLATVPAGQYDGTSYPSGGADTTSWTWATNVTNGYRLINTGTRAKVWIVDTGVLFNHQEFVSGSASRVTTRQNYATNNPASGDCNGHGTHCAGSAAGLYRGYATQAEIGSVRVLNCQGSGTNADVVAGFNFVANNQAAGKTNILSASLGGGASATTDNAINSAVQNGVVAVVAAGNDNANACNYSPARASEAITVGASNKDDGRASFSNWGTCVDVFSPGQSIHSAYYTSTTTYSTLSGTSMATPLVAGAIALYATTSTTQPVRAPTVRTAISNTATRNVITNPGTGSPNLLINANWN